VSGNTAVLSFGEPAPDAQLLALSARGNGLRIAVDGANIECELWPDGQAGPLQEAQRSGIAVCAAVRGSSLSAQCVAGTYTHLERVTNFYGITCGAASKSSVSSTGILRRCIPEKGEAGPASMPPARTVSAGAPPPPIAATFAERAVVPEHLAIDVGQGRAGLMLGQWYAIAIAPECHQCHSTGGNRYARVTPGNPQREPIGCGRVGRARLQWSPSICRSRSRIRARHRPSRVEWSNGTRIARNPSFSGPTHRQRGAPGRE